ncbi:MULTISPECIES: aspartate/glutamate racemase family protein [unclassified Brenneria]|uniref:aspartate/glutamate racemase family protein n=1 Tax=unclassified Brenneria TaxID=2634434 RepID=UPI001556D460|nr:MULTISPECIES: amino acid racemase [unclassified Brenneria]MBJ7220265.1 aspartate/glutamate racemase family protein [Brenneria sp. L3-3C-1]MEE3641510.1 amino acid racemase [Brenneria sp. L3_3C_1]MEE3649859.1 amino acid racemase [Brenneria sp. HEZEL_4_2_4]NPC99818.1 aspartate/glutamate racemase family protein [Brenneria sp. hezel4-2-4]
MNRLVGILGGMGPGATVDAMQKLIKNTPAYRDQDHIPMIAVSIPDIPDRTKCILDHSASPLEKMIQYMKILENAGAECIIIPCNTAHYWFNELKRHTRVEMISIIDTTCQVIQDKKIVKVGLLATTATIQAQIYQDNLGKNGIYCHIPTRTEQDLVMESIYAYKAGKFNQAHAMLSPIKDRMLQAGIEKIILGCTELPLILAREIQKTPDDYIDATEELIKKTVEWYFSPSHNHEVAA